MAVFLFVPRYTKAMKVLFYFVLLSCYILNGNTTPVTTSKSPGCEHNGSVYSPGEQIPDLGGQEGNHCFGAYCENSAGTYIIMNWDNFNCPQVQTEYVDCVSFLCFRYENYYKVVKLAFMSYRKD